MIKLSFGTTVPAAATIAFAVMVGAIITMGQSVAAETTTAKRESVSVYWVGHSILNTPAETKQGPVDIMSLVASFAKSRDLKHSAFDHTFTGIPISAQWRGKPYSYERDASSMVAKREAFERDAGKYDTIVLTEALPLKAVMRTEFSEYHLRKFYCTLKNANPDARVFLYQSWINLNADDPIAGFPPIEHFDWRSAMVEDRKQWELLAKAALQPKVKSPGWLSRFGMHSSTDGGCEPSSPILIVPVGEAMIALCDRLKQPKPGDDFALPGGAQLTFEDLFENPYINVPKNWPLKEGEVVEKPELVLRDPSKPLDDIHPRLPAIYLSALVHFATLYKQSPVHLPYPEEIGEPLAATLQCIAWETVTTSPLSGVTGQSACGSQ